MASDGGKVDSLKLMKLAFPAWSKSVQECEQHFEVSISRGLTKLECEHRRKYYGYNELEKHPSHPLWKLVLEQFDDMLVKVLLGAAVIS